MRIPPLLAALLLPAVPLAGCSCDGPSALDAGLDAPPAGDANDDASPMDPPLPAPFTDVEVTERYEMPALSAEAFVVRTELDVPHVYASNRVDAMRILGFIMARDRFFQMDLTRRLSQGRISELLGDAGLETDLENRLTGAAYITGLYLEAVDAEEGAELDAYAEGINAYIAEVRARRLPAPRELMLGAGFLGARNPADLMIEWDRRDVVATGASVLYGTSFEGGDVGRSRTFENVDEVFPAGTPSRDLRIAGLQADIIDHYAPPNDVSSAAGWGLETAGMGGGGADEPSTRRRLSPEALRALRGVLPERGLLDRLTAGLDRIEARFSRDPDEGYGSNSWAVMGSATTDGSSLLAGDGHLELSVPPLFWQLGIDTMLLGGATEDTRLLGATIAGLPAMGVGTNGRIAWGQTAYFADVTDWYTEEIVLDAAGLPSASVFEGSERPLVRIEERFVIKDVPALGSVGRTEDIARFTTFDGRWITAIEGRSTTADEVLGAGESRVHTLGGLVVPGDVDGDGRITAVSFYYGPFDGGSLLRAFRQFTTADTVEDFRQSLRHFVGYGGSMMASDREGSVVYSAYHAVPARDHLPRDVDNRWIAGADPRRLIDGTRYGAWHLPLDARGRVDEAAAAAGAPNEHVVPFDQWPQALNPGRQYVQMANNDPGNICTDNDLFDDPYYIGGPWIEGYRGERIAERLEAAIAGGTASLEEMQRIQGDHHSNLGEEWAPVLLDAIDTARRAAMGTPSAGTPEARLAARWTATQADYEEIERRITAWRDAGFPTPSGVETFYAPLAPGDVANSVATSIFHAWFATYVSEVLGDERIPGDLSPAVTGDTFRMQTMLLMEEGRGAGNPDGLGSFDPATNESVFFDDLRTAEIESSREIGVRAIDLALAFLRSAPTGELRGGFGTSDWDSWRWGYRHQVRFDSLVASSLGTGSSAELDLLLSTFQITPRVLPLMPELPMDDPRASLPHFPRPGDQFDIDAANPGLDNNDWTHGSGPVFRMVIALGPDGVRGQNILPGGQSGSPRSPHFADQAALWLANETIPMRYLPEEVAAGAVSIERFVP